MNRLVIVFLVIFSACTGGGKNVRVGIDPNWSLNNFQEKTSFVNGYTDELLLDISRDSGIEFQKMRANGDSLLENLQHDQYDVIISSLPLYNFNTAKYDFSRISSISARCWW